MELLTCNSLQIYKCLSLTLVDQLYKELLAELPAILDSLYTSILNNLRDHYKPLS